MTLTGDYKQTVVAHIERDPAFAKALLDEAATRLLSSEPDTARLILRDLVNATVGFEQLAELTHRTSKNLRRMLSPRGNPKMDNLAAIFEALRGCISEPYAREILGHPHDDSWIRAHVVSVLEAGKANPASAVSTEDVREMLETEYRQATTEDQELNALADARAGQPVIKVKLEEL